MKNYSVVGMFFLAIGLVRLQQDLFNQQSLHHNWLGYNTQCIPQLAPYRAFE